MIEPSGILGNVLFWLHEFQALATGILAIIAAYVTAKAIRRAAQAPVDAAERRDAELRQRRLRHACFVLASEFRRLAMEAERAITPRPGLGRIGKSAMGHELTDEVREVMTLTLPEMLNTWESASLLPKDIANRCFELSNMANKHNRQMKTITRLGPDTDLGPASGLVGGIRSSTNEIRARLEKLNTAADKLAQELESMAVDGTD